VLRPNDGCLVFGCRSPELSVGTTLVRRDDDKATIRCNSTGRQWTLKCRDSVWTPTSSDDKDQHQHQTNCSSSSSGTEVSGRGRVSGGRQMTSSSAAAGLAHHPPSADASAFPFSAYMIWYVYLEKIGYIKLICFCQPTLFCLRVFDDLTGQRKSRFVCTLTRFSRFSDGDINVTTFAVMHLGYTVLL